MRVAVDERSESVGKKIRDAELGRYPYMLVVGDREEEAGAVAVRSHEDGELGAMPLAEFAARVEAETGRLSARRMRRCLYTAPHLIAGTPNHRRR